MKHGSEKRLKSQVSLITTDKSWNTLSNGLTLVRFAAAPVVMISLYHAYWLMAFVVFMFAASTDLLDGYVARAWNEQTHLGALMDPLADKVLLVSSFGALAFFQSPFFHIPQWFFGIVVIREALIIAGSLILLFFYKDAHTQPLIWGKLTTLLQVLFLGWVFLCYFIGWVPARTYAALLVLLAFFSLISLWKYLWRAITDVR